MDIWANRRSVFDVLFVSLAGCGGQPRGCQIKLRKIRNQAALVLNKEERDMPVLEYAQFCASSEGGAEFKLVCFLHGGESPVFFYLFFFLSNQCRDKETLFVRFGLGTHILSLFTLLFYVVKLLFVLHARSLDYGIHARLS